MSKLKTTVKKALCAIIAILICFASPLSLGAAAVTYPDGVTKEACEAVIPKLDRVIPELMKLTGSDLDTLIYSSVIQDSTLNGLFKSVYSELAGSASTLSVMGVSLTPASLAQALGDYPAVAAKVAACSTIEEVIAASDSFTWGVNTKNGFAYAVAAMFSPFNTLLNAVLCGGTAQINILLAIKGDDGYGNTIVPLLKTLSCPSILSSEDFAAAAAQNRNTMVANIVGMLFASIDNMIAHPGEGICSTLPALAWYLESGKLSEAVTALTDPLALRIGIVTIPGITKLLSTISSLTGTGISASIGDIDISKLTGGAGDTIQLPELDMAALAACGTENGGTFTPDRPAALVTVTEWLVKTIKLNAEKLTADNPDTAELIKPLIQKSDSELVKAFILLLTPDSSTFINPNEWTYPDYTPGSIPCTPALTMDDYKKVLNEIDPFLNEVAAEKDPDSTIATVIKPVIYSNSLLGTLISALYSAIGTEETAPLFSMLGLNVSPAGVAASVSGSAAQTLRNASSWSSITATDLDFGFTDGDRDGFEKALNDVLAPFAPVFRYLLAEGKLTVLNEIELNGSDGYNSAIIPLLEALGCPQASIKTYAQYKLKADTSVITDITDPLLALLDTICEKPVSTLCSMLPNLLYFLNGGGLKTCITNLIYPLTAKLEQLGLSDMLPADLLSTDELDINGAFDKLTASSDLGIKLKKPDLSKIAMLGEKTTAVSKRTSGGQQTAYTYIKADGPAVLLTLLRYLVDTLSMEENASVLSGFMSSVMSSGDTAETGEPDMMGMYAGSIGEKFKGMTTDEIIEWLYDLLFRETPKVDLEKDEFIPTVIYEKEKGKSPAAIIIILLLLVLAAAAAFILNKRGKFDKLKEKHRLKKAKKEEKRPTKKKKSKRQLRKEKKKDKKQAKKDKKQAKKARKTADAKAKTAFTDANEETNYADIVPELKPAVMSPDAAAAIASKQEAEKAAEQAPAVKTDLKDYRASLLMPLSPETSGRKSTKAAATNTAKTSAPSGTPVTYGTGSRTAAQPYGAPVSGNVYTNGLPRNGMQSAADASRPVSPEMIMQPVVTSVPMTPKRAAKLNKRQRKAAELAIKQQQQSNRYYREAIAANEKKNAKGGRK